MFSLGHVEAVKACLFTPSHRDWLVLSRAVVPGLSFEYHLEVINHFQPGI